VDDLAISNRAADCCNSKPFFFFFFLLYYYYYYYYFVNVLQTYKCQIMLTYPKLNKKIMQIDITLLPLSPSSF